VAEASIRQETFNATVLAASQQQGITLNEAQLAKLYAYFGLFIKWNATYNLSAVRDPEEILVKHIVDSLAIEALFREHDCQRIIDVGTGGGLPGMVLAICHEDREFTLLDSAGKKVRFLFQVCQSLELSNVELKNCRVESLQPAEKFDVVVSRAFASLEKFTSITSHLLQPEGEFWAMKGLYPEQELSELEKHYIVVGHHSLRVPGLDGERCLIRIKHL